MDARSKWMCPLQSPNCLTFFYFIFFIFISKIENKTFVFRRNGNSTSIIFSYKWASCDKMSSTQSIINEDRGFQLAQLVNSLIVK